VTGNPDNQNLADFLARHVRPYDPAKDDYDRPPFAADIKEGKNDPIYNAHSYHTKVPPRSIIPYILHYTQPGDLVLDVFCGSGMTGVAAQMCAHPPADLLEQFPELKDRVGPRACILNDLSPAACHIAYNYNAPVAVEALKREFERIKAAVKDEFDRLYGTEHYEPAVGLYDPANLEIASRLKNPPPKTASSTLLGDEERTWELLTKAQVEERLGYSVTELPHDEDWGKLDVAKVERWICIPATILYTIWSDVYSCEGFVTLEEPTGKVSTRGKNAGKPIFSKKRVARGCGAEIVLWEVAINHATGEVFETFACPACGQRWKKTQISRSSTRPVAVNYDYYGLRQPSRNASSSKVLARLRSERTVSDLEISRIRRAEEEAIPYWFPAEPLDTKGPQYSRNALSARKVQTQADFYTRRNLRALARLWHEFSSVPSQRLSAALLFVWTSIYNRSSRRTKWHRSRLGQAALSGQLYIPSLQVENNILSLMVAKLGQIVNGLSSLTAREGMVAVSCDSAGKLKSLPQDSIDYVFWVHPRSSCLDLWRLRSLRTR
jgi:hypothetical protein